MKKIMKILVLFLALFVLISCGEKTASKDSTASSEASTAAKKRDVLNVTVSIPPQAFIVKTVGKDKVKVNTMMEPSSTPETYEPGPKKMADLKDSALYLKIGVPFEAASIEKLEKDYPNLKFADMHKGIALRKMGKHGGCPKCGGKECPCKGDKECCKKHGGCDCLNGKGCPHCDGKECPCKGDKECCKKHGGCDCLNGKGCGCHGSEIKKETEKEDECGADACSVPEFDAPKAEEPEHHNHHHDGMHEGCHGHEHEHRHHHHGMHDPHVWLDPMNLIVMTDNTVAELSAVDPENAAFYRENGETLKAEIKKVNDEVAAQLKEVEGKSFVVHHPAFGYFAERFGLKQVPLEIEGKEPGAVDMAKVVDFIKKNNAKAVFMQAQIPDSVIKSVAEETKVRVITLDPLKENVLENIRETAKEIKGALIDEK